MLHGREVGQAQGAARPQLCKGMSQVRLQAHLHSYVAQKHYPCMLNVSRCITLRMYMLHQLPGLRGDGALVGSQDCNPPAAFFMLSRGSQAPSPLAAASAASSAAQSHMLEALRRCAGALPSDQPGPITTMGR